MYEEYIEIINAGTELRNWAKTTLKAYLKKHNPPQEEVEHMLDYCVSDEAPRKMVRMSYVQLKELAWRWTKAQQKKGAHIEEGPTDTKTVYKFKDGSRIAKLIGKAAYDREGFLMGHCVGSLYGKKNIEIYSYRDKSNGPHITFDLQNNNGSISQLKGKGNGSVHPKYIEPILEFLEFKEIAVRASEMKNLGYHHVEDSDTKSLIVGLFPKAQFKVLGGNEFVFAG